MTNDQPAAAVPPIEPTPAVTPPAPPPPVVDPYAAAAPTPPPAVSYAPAGYAPAGYAPAGYAPGVYYPPPPPRGLATASMVLGIVGVFFSFGYGFGLFPSIAAVITGHMARKRQPYARGMWLAGLICGYIGIGISVLWVAAIIVFAFFAISTNGFNTGGVSSGDFSNT